MRELSSEAERCPSRRVNAPAIVKRNGSVWRHNRDKPRRLADEVAIRSRFEWIQFVGIAVRMNIANGTLRATPGGKQKAAIAMTIAGRGCALRTTVRPTDGPSSAKRVSASPIPAAPILLTTMEPVCTRVSTVAMTTNSGSPLLLVGYFPRRAV